MKTAYILTVRRLLFVLIDDCFALSFFIPTANETISNREENNLHDCYAEHQRSTEDLIGQRVWSCAVISCDTLWSVNSIAGRDQLKTHQVNVGEVYSRQVSVKKDISSHTNNYGIVRTL